MYPVKYRDLYINYTTKKYLNRQNLKKILKLIKILLRKSPGVFN